MLLGDPRGLSQGGPPNGLGPSGMREILVLLLRRADEGTTVFVSSHLMSEVEAMCDRVGVLTRGRLVAEAGGGLRAVDGGPYDPFSIDALASNGPLQPALRVAVRKDPCSRRPARSASEGFS